MSRSRQQAQEEEEETLVGDRALEDAVGIFVGHHNNRKVVKDKIDLLQFVDPEGIDAGADVVITKRRHGSERSNQRTKQRQNQRERGAHKSTEKIFSLTASRTRRVDLATFCWKMNSRRFVSQLYAKRAHPNTFSSTPSTGVRIEV